MIFGILGFGKMGGAFAVGAEKLYGKENIVVFDAAPSARERAEKSGYKSVNTASELFDSSEFILVSVKPQDLADAVRDVSARGKTVLSIAAGVKTETLAELFDGALIARAMPNTCAQILKCCSTLSFAKDFPISEKKKVEDLLDALGGFVEVSEKAINDLLAVGGSFTAYTYLYLKYFAEYAAERGVDRLTAITLAAKTAIGASEMILKGEKDVDALIKDVCSKGGTTLAGLAELDVEDFRSAIKKCVNACSDRAEELGK